MRKFAISIIFFISAPLLVKADFSQPSFTGYFTVDSQQNHSSGSSNALWASFSQTLNLPSTPSEDAPAIYLKMTAEDLGLKSHCKFFMALIVRTQFGSYLLRPEGDSGPYGPFGAVYYIGGADYANDPNNLVGHEVTVPFTKVEENYQFAKVTNLNQLRNFYFTGLLPTDSGDPTCYFSEGIQNYWVDVSVKIGHGEDILPNSSTTYQTTLRQTTETPEDLTFTFKTKKPYTGKTPVLIVPGVLGTDLYKGQELYWANIKMSFRSDSFMDPLLLDNDLKPIESGISTGDVIRDKSVAFFHSEYILGLINELISADIGYTEGKDLFTFPYDWRFGVSGTDEDGKSSTDHFKGQIEYILTQTEAGKGAGKVNVVAHSTGGLIVKQYIKTYPDSHNIDTAVFVGVPNLGAPKAIKMFISGDNMDVMNLNPNQMKKLAKNLPVVYDLAPTREYYNKAGSFYHFSGFDSLGQLKQKDFNFEEAYDSLNLNKFVNPLAVNKAKELHSADFDNYDMRNAEVDLYNIVGCKSATFSGVTEKNTLYTKDFDYPKLTSGDKTVPFVSADSLMVDEKKTFFAPKIGHGNLLSEDGTRQLITNILAGSTLDTKGKILTRSEVKNKPELCEIKGENLVIKSPVAIDATDSSGNHAGILEDGSIENNIPGADFEVWGEHKYVFLPTDEGQSYTITLQGTGSGTFTFINKTQIGNEFTGGQVFANIPVTPALKGVIEFNGDSALLKLDNDGDGETDQILEPDSFLDQHQLRDLISPISTSTVTGNLSASASVSLAATDPIIEGRENETSGLLRTYYSLNNSSYMTYISPISLTESGDYNVSFYSIDKAGNKEDEQVVNLTVASQPSGNQPTYSGGGGGSGCLDCQPPRDVALKFIKTENGKSFFSLSAKDESLPLSMQLSENKDMAKVVWQKFSGEIEWAFSTSTIKTLYARVRDSYLNSSNVVEAAGLWDETVSPGKVLGENTGVLAIHPTGSLVVDQNGTVYMVQGSVIRPFTSAKRFLKLKFKFKNVQAMWPGDSQFLLGMPM